MKESEFPIGHLVVTMYIQLPNASKKVTLASIPCEWADRQKVFDKFKSMNSDIHPDQIGGEFILRDYM